MIVDRLEYFPKEHSDYFSDPKAYLPSASFEGVTLLPPYDGNEEKFLADARAMTREVDAAVWACMVRYVWLYRRFARENVGRSNLQAFSTVLKRFAEVYPSFCVPGYDSLLWFVTGNWRACLLPLREQDSPFDTVPQFPWKNLSLLHVAAVARMQEAVDLLDHADRRKMGLHEFLDFVACWVYGYNRKYGQRYQFRIGAGKVPAVVLDLTTDYGRQRMGNVEALVASEDYKEGLEEEDWNFE